MNIRFAPSTVGWVERNSEDRCVLQIPFKASMSPYLIRSAVKPNFIPSARRTHVKSRRHFTQLAQKFKGINPSTVSITPRQTHRIASDALNVHKR